eukprot:Gb_29583 [translate_table: standard]
MPCNLKKMKPQIVNEKASKKSRVDGSDNSGGDRFERLPDDLVIAIFISLSSTATSPADLANAMLACRRFCSLSLHPWVLAGAGIGTLAVKASNWSDGAHRFLKRCADVGNVEACYSLGIKCSFLFRLLPVNEFPFEIEGEITYAKIRFYCLGNRSGGASLMAKAAMASHAGALHSLAVIQFNGSGGSKKDKDLNAGVALCARAASLGQVDAMRDLGHCLQDGYGVARNVAEGRRLLLEANAREAAAAGFNPPQACVQTALKMRSNGHHGIACLHNHQFPADFQTLKKDLQTYAQHDVFCLLQRTCCSLLSDFGCNVPPAEPHIANKFLVDWFSLHPPAPGLRLCSFHNCGRPETRRHEFRRCSACGSVNYCSRACQALDWKICHRYDCMPSADWEDLQENDVEDEDYFDNFGEMDDVES